MRNLAKACSRSPYLRNPRSLNKYPPGISRHSSGVSIICAFALSKNGRNPPRRLLTSASCGPYFSKSASSASALCFSNALSILCSSQLEIVPDGYCGFVHHARLGTKYCNAPPCRWIKPFESIAGATVLMYTVAEECRGDSSNTL